MKAFGIWLAIVAVVFGVYALVTISLRETTQVYVFVDSSNQMATKSSALRRELGELNDRERTEFALAAGQDFSGAELVHGWQEELALPADQGFFGPCSFDGAASFPEASDADERILVTVAGNSCDTSALTDWQIIELD